MSGGSLSDFLETLRCTPVYLREAAVKKIIKDVAHALYDLHQICKIMHRDVKPTNILFEHPPPNWKENETDRYQFLQRMPRAILADLGIALLMHSENGSSKHRIGTDGFIAPEVELG